MEHESSLPYSQEPATVLYPESLESYQHSHTLQFNINILLIIL